MTSHYVCVLWDGEISFGWRGRIKQTTKLKIWRYKQLGKILGGYETKSYTAISKKIVIVNSRCWNQKELWVQS